MNSNQRLQKMIDANENIIIKENAEGGTAVFSFPFVTSTISWSFWSRCIDIIIGIGVLDSSFFRVTISITMMTIYIQSEGTSSVSL